MGEIFRKIKAVKVSENHGESWKTWALCSECSKNIEPPRRRKFNGEAAVRRCDWCGARNIADKPQVKGDAEARDDLAQWKIDGFNAGLGTSIFAVGMRRIEPDPSEDLPVEAVNLDIAYSPIIPISGGGLDEAVEVEKINNFLYRFEYRHQQFEVSDDKIKEMRARYIITHNEAAKKFMRENNPPGSIWHKLGTM
jgi:hypothetical protein